MTKARFRELVAEVGERIGLPIPQIMYYPINWDMMFNSNIAAVSPGFGKTTDAILYGDGILSSSLSEDAVRGMIAHEYGHLSGIRDEALADKFAAEAGYAAENIAALEYIDSVWVGAKSDSSHSPFSDRIKFFRSYLPPNSAGVGTAA